MPVRSASVLAVLLLLLSSCTSEQRKSRTKAEKAQAITEVFETKVEYTVHHLDSNAVIGFIAEHPASLEDSAAITDFYKRRAYQYAWFVNDSLSAAARNLLGLMSSTDSILGTGPEDPHRVHELVTGLMIGDTMPLTPERMRNAELALTAQYFLFARSHYGGFIRKDVRDLDWFIPRKKKNYDQLLDSLANGRMDLSPIEPVHPQYGALKAQLKKYYQLDTLAAWDRLSLGDRRKLEPGDTASFVPELRQRLMLMGDLVSEGDTVRMASMVYDSTLVHAVERFQTRHGLHPDGIIGNGVMRMLNITPGERIRTLLVNMERLRWVPEQYPPDLLLVNIPEYRLHIFEQGKEAWSMDVVVGADATRTVIFSDTLSRIVFSPYWGVPTSIVQNEVLPAMKKDPNYLSKKGMERIGGSDANPLIRQKPGAGNALGRVKFLFPNSYSIYFHDTPSKGAFARESRAFSHGCIRLSKPQDLADYLLRNDSTWTPEKIKKAMFGEKEITVNLPKAERRPVMIGYFTAWVDNGQLNFRDDVYGNDAKLAAELFVTGEEPVAVR
ncbi:MAG TPA: L,D-transpeptidase family protein [Flavobacteriales bacterium]